jgi:hypothetical protein
MPNLYVSEGPLFLTTITVTYSEKATCTIENYRQTYTAPDTSGSWKFYVREAGYYTVTCKNNGFVNTQQVAVWKQGENIDVDLRYEYYIFKSGEGLKAQISSVQEPGSTVAVGSSQITISNVAAAVDAYSTFYTSSPIDITQYSMLHIRYTAISADYPLCFGLMSSEPTAGNSYSGAWVAKWIVTNTTAGSGSYIDISDFSGPHYIVVTAAGETTITNIYLNRIDRHE